MTQTIIIAILLTAVIFLLVLIKKITRQFMSDMTERYNEFNSVVERLSKLVNCPKNASRVLNERSNKIREEKRAAGDASAADVQAEADLEARKEASVHADGSVPTDGAPVILPDMSLIKFPEEAEDRPCECKCKE